MWYRNNINPLTKVIHFLSIQVRWVCQRVSSILPINVLCGQCFVWMLWIAYCFVVLCLSWQKFFLPSYKAIETKELTEMLCVSYLVSHAQRCFSDRLFYTLTPCEIVLCRNHLPVYYSSPYLIVLLIKFS